MAQNKKHIIVLTTIFSIFIAFEIYGKQIAVYYFDTFHKRLCTDSFCINKPKGWMPWLVKRNDTDYVMNLFPKKVLFWAEAEEENVSQQLKTEVILSKNNENIVIYSHRNLQERNFLKYKKYTIENSRCYEEDTFSLLCFGDKKINILHNKLGIEVIKKMLK